jgi:hypothetical protein
MWQFNDSIRLCLTCYCEMGDEARKKFVHDAQSGASKMMRQAVKAVGMLAAAVTILGASFYFCYKPLVGQLAEHRVAARDARLPLRR